MESFTIKGEFDFITLTFEEVFSFPETTCHWGGYDVRAILEIQSGDFHVKSNLYTSTGEIFEFSQQLKSCNEKLKGTSKYISYEGNLELIAEYDNAGHVNVKGEFSAQNQFGNKLTFEFSSDQTFISIALKDLEAIAEKYGDKNGIKK